MKRSKKGDGGTPPPSPNVQPNLQFTPSTPPAADANVDRHRARFTGGKLFLRELVYRVQLEGQEKLVLPRVRLEVVENPPSWLPPRKRRRPNLRSPIPSLTRKKYLQSRALKDWLRWVVEMVCGYRGHMYLTLTQTLTDSPLMWEGKCDLCESKLLVQGTWSGSDNLPTMSGTAFLQNCTGSVVVKPATTAVVVRRNATPGRRIFRLIPRAGTPKK